MCNPVNGGGALPVTGPGYKADDRSAPPAPAATTAMTATTGGGEAGSSVGGAAGQAAAGTAALGGGESASLAGVLQQLLDAVKALASAVGGMSGGGPIQLPEGSPIQVPPGKVGQTRGGGPDANPLDRLESDIRQSMARATPAQKARLEQVLQRLSNARSEAAESGAFNPLSLLRVDVLHRRAMAAQGSAAGLDALLKDVDAARSRSERIGSFDPQVIRALSQRLDRLQGRQ